MISIGLVLLVSKQMLQGRKSGLIWDSVNSFEQKGHLRLRDSFPVQVAHMACPHPLSTRSHLCSMQTLHCNGSLIPATISRHLFTSLVFASSSTASSASMMLKILDGSEPLYRISFAQSSAVFSSWSLIWSRREACGCRSKACTTASCCLRTAMCSTVLFCVPLYCSCPRDRSTSLRCSTRFAISACPSQMAWARMVKPL
mmetsp:Transcript_126056/g.351249  ORF Transcript_126056/g.351249 Transcript_126056/m.351249 type:complete len:200 (+) Transcript_126056:261-860(+)